MADTEVVAGTEPTPDANALAREAEGNAFEKTMRSAYRVLDEARTPEPKGKDGARAPQGSDAFSITDEEEDESKADAKSDTKGEADDGSKQDEKGDDGKDKPKDGEKPDAADKGEDAAKGARFQLIGADGKPVPDGVKWPEGAKMRFTVDGRPVTVKSPDHLVAMAQRGALADRHEARATRAERTVDTLSERIREVNQKSQDILLAAIFGTEDRSAEEITDALKEILEPYRNPEFRKGQEALREKAAAEEQDEAAEAEQAQERTAAIWSHADAVFEDSLTEFPYLEASDAVAAKSVLHQRYVQAHAQATRDLAPEAKARRWTARQYAAEVEAIASQELTEENLKAVMQDLNHTYERRLKGKGAPPATPSKPSAPAVKLVEDEDDEDESGEDIEAEATAHNAKTAGKLEQRERSRTLRGGGSPAVAGVRVANLEGKSYEEQQAAWKKELRSLAR